MISNFRPWVKLSGVFISLTWYLGCLLAISSVRGKDVERGFKFRRRFCRTSLSILGIKFQPEANLHEGVCLYVSNHRSMLDPLVQLAFINAFIVSKSEVGGYPLLGRGAKETGIILVDRSDQSSRRSALDAIELKLKSGHPVLIYPEGTTHGGDLTGEFKKGAFELARRNDIPIIPVMIEYPDASYYWVDGTLMQYFQRIFSTRKKHNVTVRLGKVIRHNENTDTLEKTKAEINAMIIDTRTSFVKNQ
jgi:1-acyl-sn-glycerol-3-phosphate acyltransferase